MHSEQDTNKTVKLKDYDVIIDGCNLFHQPVSNKIKTYEKIRISTTDQGDLPKGLYLKVL